MTSPELHDDEPRVRPVSRLPVGLDGAQVPVTVQARVALTQTRAAIRAYWKARIGQDGGVVNGMLGWHPPSVTEQIEYAQKRRWVSPGHESGLFERAGARFQRRHGIPGVALGNAITGIHARSSAGVIAYLIATALIVAVLRTAV